jgi:hypothetical protein
MVSTNSSFYCEPEPWLGVSACSLYEYSSVEPLVDPEDNRVVPPLVIRARQMGLDV